VRPALEARYEKLDGARAAFGDAAGGERTVAADLRSALASWRKALDDGDPGDQVEASNRLEADGSRLQANVLGLPRLYQSQELLDALAAYNASAPDPNLVRAYNRAVRDYGTRAPARWRGRLRAYSTSGRGRSSSSARNRRGGDP
jgi:hypothetical protein